MKNGNPLPSARKRVPIDDAEDVEGCLLLLHFLRAVHRAGRAWFPFVRGTVSHRVACDLRRAGLIRMRRVNAILDKAELVESHR